MSKTSNINPSNEAQSIHIQVIVKADGDSHMNAIDFTVAGQPSELSDVLSYGGYRFLEFRRNEQQESAFVVVLDDFEQALPVWMLFKNGNENWQVSDMRISAEQDRRASAA